MNLATAQNPMKNTTISAGPHHTQARWTRLLMGKASSDGSGRPLNATTGRPAVSDE
jgi:hypothetical protein